VFQLPLVADAPRPCLMSLPDPRPWLRRAAGNTLTLRDSLVTWLPFTPIDCSKS